MSTIYEAIASCPVIEAVETQELRDEWDLLRATKFPADSPSGLYIQDVRICLALANARSIRHLLSQSECEAIVSMRSELSSRIRQATRRGVRHAQLLSCAGMSERI